MKIDEFLGVFETPSVKDKIVNKGDNFISLYAEKPYLKPQGPGDKRIVTIVVTFATDPYTGVVDFTILITCIEHFEVTQASFLRKEDLEGESVSLLPYISNSFSLL